MNQPNELKDFWRRTTIIYIDNTPFYRYQSITYGLRQPDKTETEIIKNLIDMHNPNFNRRIYGQLKHKFNGDIWYKNGYIKVYNYLSIPYSLYKIEDTALVTIETTYSKAYDNMNEMMRHTNPMEAMGYEHYLYSDKFGGIKRKDGFIPKTGYKHNIDKIKPYVERYKS